MLQIMFSCHFNIHKWSKTVALHQQSQKKVKNDTPERGRMHFIALHFKNRNHVVCLRYQMVKKYGFFNFSEAKYYYGYNFLNINDFFFLLAWVVWLPFLKFKFVDITWRLITKVWDLLNFQIQLCIKRIKWSNFTALWSSFLLSD